MEDNLNDSKSTTHQEITLELNADVAEWCPLLSNGHRRLIAAGTYQLNEATQERQGRLYIYKLHGEINKTSKLSLHCATTHDVPGIFDLKWLPENFSSFSQHHPSMVAALADGSLRVLNFVDSEQSSAEIVEKAQIESPEGGMALSVDCRCSNDNERSIDGVAARLANNENLISSYSDGTLATHQLTSAGLTSLHSWKGHDLEAWTCSFDNWNPNIAYSGGDDSVFKVWDLRCNMDSALELHDKGANVSLSSSPPSQLWLDRKSHSAGVCCIVSSPFQPHMVMTGSYDERARFWDIRQGARPLAVGDVGTGGGVWRLKWHPSDPNLLLAACMHGGFTIIEANGAEGSVKVVERYPHQQTLAYGAGWCAEVGHDGSSVAATASFYDRLLHIWTPETLANVASV